MRFCKLTLATLLLALILSGCEGAQNVQDPMGTPEPSLEARDLYTTLLRNIPENMQEATDHFGVGQYPAVVLAGYADKSVVLTILERESGTTIASDRRYITADLAHSDFSHLRAGDYTVRVYVDDALQDSYSFTVSR